MEKPDTTDQNIISALSANPRSTNKEIATLLDIAESTVAQRIRAMAERGVMRVVAQKHVFSDGYIMMCFLFVNTSRRTVQNIGAEMEKHSEILSVSQGVGNPDIFAVMRVRSVDQAHELANLIGTIKGIDNVDVCVCFRVHKFVSNLGDTSAVIRHVGDPENPDSIFVPLSQDGRQSNREVARQLSISEGTVRQRLNKMLRAGVLQFQVVCSPEAMDINATAIARITSLTRYTEDIIEELAQLESISFLAEVTGEANLIALIITTDIQELGNVCDNHLVSIRGITSLQVQLLVSTSKHQFHYAYFEGLKDIPRRK